MFDRLRLAKKVDQIILCTSPLPEDQPLVDLARCCGVGCHRGDPDDVLLRLLGATREFQLDYCLNITADSPFADPVYIDKIVGAYGETGADLIRTFGLPHGAFSYGIRPEALAKIVEIKDSNTTEVWGKYFTDTGLFRVYDLPIENAFHRQPHLRMTLDYPEDLRFFEAVFEALYREGEVFSLDQILELLRRHPEIVEINRHCHKPFQRRWLSQSEIRLKPRFTVAKAAVIGCGSIGQRHIRNLRKLGITQVTALRTRQGHFRDLPPELEVREARDWTELLAAAPDIAIVSNPTSLHLDTVHRLLPNVKGIFIEKPLAQTLDGVPELLDRIRDAGIVSFVGYNLPFHPAVRTIYDLLQAGRLGDPLVLQGQVGHWLPDWHPYEDYRQAYYARRDLGGGVTRTLSHEIHLAQHLLGAARAAHGVFPAHESLPLDVDVIADLTTRHASGAVSQLHLDYLQRRPHRCGVLSGTQGWAAYDLFGGQVVAQTADDASPAVVWDGKNYDANEQYVDELATFLRFVREGRARHAHDAWQGAITLAAVVAALESAGDGGEHELPPWVQAIGS